MSYTSGVFCCRSVRARVRSTSLPRMHSRCHRDHARAMCIFFARLPCAALWRLLLVVYLARGEYININARALVHARRTDWPAQIASSARPLRVVAILCAGCACVPMMHHTIIPQHGGDGGGTHHDTACAQLRLREAVASWTLFALSMHTSVRTPHAGRHDTRASDR